MTLALETLIYATVLLCVGLALVEAIRGVQAYRMSKRTSRDARAVLAAVEAMYQRRECGL